ncbi:MAG TPA: VOC family protein [Bdellovibrionota bacterium]|jgi:predicted enzyme related to lactoylglutathione lyase|nr:VOC family protein [Bdellovibrionota bacterium]
MSTSTQPVSATLAVYQRKAGATRDDVLKVIREHQALLVKKGYVATKPITVLEQESFIIETVYWLEGASERAHADAEVQSVWGAYEACVSFKTLADLPAAQQVFAKLVPLEPLAHQAATLADTMMPAKDFEKLARFYENFSGMRRQSEQSCFVNLQDTNTGNVLCVVEADAVSRAAPSFGVEDLSVATGRARELGAKIIHEWEFERLRGANLNDPEGNEFMIWQVKGA